MIRRVVLFSLALTAAAVTRWVVRIADLMERVENERCA